MISPWCLILMLSPGRIRLSSRYQRPSASTWLTSQVKLTGWRSVVSTSSSSFTMWMSLAVRKYSISSHWKQPKCALSKLSVQVLVQISNVARCSIFNTLGFWNRKLYLMFKTILSPLFTRQTLVVAYFESGFDQICHSQRSDHVKSPWKQYIFMAHLWHWVALMSGCR